MELWDLLLPSTFSSSNLLPPPSYSSQLLHSPPKPSPNSYVLLKGLRWLISSYMKIFQYFNVILLRKVLWWVGGWRHCNYSYLMRLKTTWSILLANYNFKLITFHFLYQQHCVSSICLNVFDWTRHKIKIMWWFVLFIENCDDIIIIIIIDFNFSVI